MDPISLAMGVAGLGMQIFGGLGASGAASKVAQASQNEAAQEIGINNAKQAAMELNGRRTQMENIRNNQRARAQATNAATNQGAQFGTGLQGGLAQVNDQSQFNMLGVNDALQTGRQINSFNTQIDMDKSNIASAQSTMATDQGYASLGGALMKAGPMVGPLAQSGGTAFGNAIGNAFIPNGALSGGF